MLGETVPVIPVWTLTCSLTVKTESQIEMKKKTGDREAELRGKDRVCL